MLGADADEASLARNDLVSGFLEFGIQVFLSLLVLLLEFGEDSVLIVYDSFSEEESDRIDCVVRLVIVDVPDVVGT